jgi:hypothetical protein
MDPAARLSRTGGEDVGIADDVGIGTSILSRTGDVGGLRLRASEVRSLSRQALVADGYPEAHVAYALRSAATGGELRAVQCSLL